MNTGKSLNIWLIVIGILSVITGAYLAWKGKPPGEFYPGILIGILLIGAAWISFARDKKQNGDRKAE